MTESDRVMREYEQLQATLAGLSPAARARVATSWALAHKTPTMNLGAAIDYARQFAYDAPAMHHDYEQTADAFAALLEATVATPPLTPRRSGRGLFRECPTCHDWHVCVGWTPDDDTADE